jgi:uncharacterized repeat protein (TIGR01451 family)
MKTKKHAGVQMMHVRSHRLALVLSLAVLALSAVSSWARPFDGSNAGTVISNRAEATYQNEAGESFSTASETVTVTVMAVAAVAISPHDTAPSNTLSPNDSALRVFRVCNTGNTADAVVVTRVDITAPVTIDSAYFDLNGDGVVNDGDTKVELNQTSSPQLQPGGCVAVLVGIKTNDVAPHTTVSMNLAVRSTAANAANGHGEDVGTIINSVGEGPRFTDPNNPAIQPSNLINGKSEVVLSTGTLFTNTIDFKNSGDTAARNVVLTGNLPDGVEIVADSLQVEAQSSAKGTANQTDAHRFTVQFPLVQPGEVVRISVRGKINGNFAGGAVFVFQPVISADNIAPVKCVVARVVLNPFGVVFAGRAGSSTPVNGAQIEVLLDANSGSPVKLAETSGFAPNDKNENPFVTDGQGHYSFGLADNADNKTYFLRVQAQGYLSRMIQVGVTRTQPGVFSLSAHAMDNQPLAVATGFDLVRTDVRFENVAAFAMNVPMFENSGLQITKSVDKARADIGDTVTYQIEVHNPTAAVVDGVVVNDHLPVSFQYAAGSARVSVGSSSAQTIEPQLQKDGMTFALGEVAHGATVRLIYRVRVGVNAREGDQENLASASGVFPSGEKTAAGPARAIVNVSAGVFSTRQVLVGRVFVDLNGNGQFDENDRPMPGVRLFLTNGESVVTDSAGLYNFPSLGDGSQVVSIDPITVPAGYALSDGGRESGKGWTRLLRTPVGGGALLRQNFALVQTSKAPVANNQMLADNKIGKKIETVPTNGGQPVPSPQLPAPTAGAGSPVVQGPGTYEMAATESVAPVAAGEIQILSPAANSVSMTPGLQVVTRVALNWTVKLEVNGTEISEKNIGVKSLDRKNQVSTFTFVGLNLQPGPNTVRATAISPDGAIGHVQELMVMGRGPAHRLQIVSAKSEIQAGNHDATTVTVKAFDQWNNPALDGQVELESSLGQVLRANGSAAAEPSVQLTASSQSNQPAKLVLQLENGEATAQLVGSGTLGEARLRAQTGDLQAENSVRITPESRPTILVGMGEMSFGKSIPEVSLRNETGNFRSHTSFFFSGEVFGKGTLTLSYDSQRPINRTTGRDRLFQLDPLDRVYPVFGDSSTRFEAAPSNSKLYARFDHKRSFFMFGDFQTDMDAPLAGYDRKLTGVKAHLENSGGDFITITGARPDTAFARDVFPAGTLSLMQLSNAEILPGSETVTLEVRDRRNPEVILSQETLVRSVDYNLDAANGTLFLLRYVSTFDRTLNLTQIVVTYEHRATGLGSAVYTARARKNFKHIGLRVGLSAALQREAGSPNFFLGGVDAEKTLPRGGSLQLAWARSRGQLAGIGNTIGTSADTEHNGDAYQLTLQQPLPFFNSIVRARFQKASENFLNPFGGTVTPGARRGEISLEMKPFKSSTFHFGVTDERNQTANVNNSRLTLSAALDQRLSERVKLHFGYDHRSLTDNLNDKKTDSNLITVGADVQVTDKLQFSAKREQNLGEADPTYPNQTTLGATYQLSARAKLFFTQRLASAPIVPIADFTANGFAGSQSRRETAFGVETQLGKNTAATTRYQLENGINGTDSFAVMGLQHSLPINKQLSFEVGFERAFHLAGPDKSYNSGTFGLSWQPNESFRASARYEYRDRGGVNQQLTVGAAGKITENITAMSRFQMSRGSFEGKSNQATDGMAAVAVRPLNSDRMGVLFSYTHKSTTTQDAPGSVATRDRIDTLATDAYRQMNKRLEIYGHFALSHSANGDPQLPFVSTSSFLAQGRAQYQFTKRIDAAIETRMLFQPSSHTERLTHAAEIGYWVLPDLRVGVGYNFNVAKEPLGASGLPTRRGYYFTVTSKISRLFNLFGTKAAPSEEETK